MNKLYDEIYETKDYSIFKLRDDNRFKIRESHINFLAESIKEKNLIQQNPILVNKNMEVIDGQHRLLALKKLNETVYFKILNDVDIYDLILINKSLKWGYEDYLNFYIKRGNQNYVKLQEFMKKTNTNALIAARLNSKLLGSNSLTKLLRNGKFVFNDEDNIDKVVFTTDIINQIQNVKGYTAFIRSNKFFEALLNLVLHPKYDHLWFMKNISRFHNKIVPQPNREAYQNMLESIYNYDRNVLAPSDSHA